MNKNLLTRLGETIDQYRAEQRNQPRLEPDRLRLLKFLARQSIPNLATIAVVALLLSANNAGALTLRAPNAAGMAISTQTIPYQGRIANASGQAITGTQPMIFRLYNAASGGVSLWEESRVGPNSVPVSDGLFNVMLGSLSALPQNLIAGNQNLWLGIMVGSDNEMTPRVQLGSVPFAMSAPFGGRPNSYPYVTHMKYFLLNQGSFNYGYAPGDTGSAWGLAEGVNFFTDGLSFYTPSGDGAIKAAFNSFSDPQDMVASRRWGYSYSYFLNNPGPAKNISLPLNSCNDVAAYTLTGPVSPHVLGNAGNQAYHRFPGNFSGTGNDPTATCPCQLLHPNIALPSGDFRLNIMTRGSACTGYIELTGDWIKDAGLTVDWTNLRTYLGEN